MRRWLVALLAAFLFGLSAWYTYVSASSAGQVAATLTTFIDSLAANGESGPELYEANQPDALSSLALLAADGALGTDVRVNLFSLPHSRHASVTLSLPGAAPLKLTFTIRPTPAGWRVNALPDVLAHPAAYSLNVPGGSPALLIRGRKLSISGGAGLPGGNQVIYAVTLGTKVVYAKSATATPISRVLRLREREFIESEREGLLPLAWHAALYDATGDRPAVTGGIIPGSDGVSVYLWRNLVYGVVATKPFVPDTIRVALNTTDFGGLEHSSVVVSSPGDMTLSETASGLSRPIVAGVRLSFRRVLIGDQPGVAAYDNAGNELARSAARLAVTPAGSGRVTLESVIRGFAPNRVSPSYRGRLEIAAALPPVRAPGLAMSGAAGLNVISELPLDQYLYAVVPSEMPVSYGLEALKVQALAARAYAVASMLSGGNEWLGVHVDDSTSSQVYGNIAEQPAGNAAVDATAGLLPAYQGKVADTRFFSTSCGFTASAGEVWADPGDKFPGTNVPYLVAQPQTSVAKTFADEQAFRVFITRTDLDAPDAASPWFRWTVTMTRQELEASIKANLAQRQQAQPVFVLKRDASGIFIQSAVSGDPIGTLSDIRVAQRGAGGNAMVLEISGTNGTYRIIKEYNIRMLLKPVQYLSGRPAISTVLSDGGNRANYGLLPSAFAVFDLERGSDGSITRVIIRGGGNGHGVGMSQEGARGLAAQGWSYDRIIAHYYPGTEIVSLNQVTAR